MHVIDESSPLHGLDADRLAQSDIRLFLTVEAQDQALATVVQDMKHYDAAHIRFGHALCRFCHHGRGRSDGGFIKDQPD